eukprot:scaffold136161_cov36-Cyclotella_meneghiniana.AAC.1
MDLGNFSDEDGDDSDNESVLHQEGEIHADDGNLPEDSAVPAPVPDDTQTTDGKWSRSSGPRVYKCCTTRKRLSYQQSLKLLQVESDRVLNTLELRDDVESLQELLEGPLSRFITLSANSWGYGGTVNDFLVQSIHPLFLKAKAEASKADNPSWWEAMKSPFADEHWIAAQKEINTLEKMGVWDVVDQPEGANVIDSTWAFK